MGPGPGDTVPLPPPLPFARPGAMLGRYALVEEVGRGSMGIVYRARHAELDREVALKLLRDGSGAMLKRFMTEAQSAARLRHPGIVAVHDVGEQDGHHWFTMDFIRGRSLQVALAEKRLSIRDRARIVEQTARAVHFAHENGVIHRDLKPANIMLDAAGSPVVTDFGLARLVDRGTRITRDGASLGTPHYMSPEQVTGDVAAISPRTDVYALGVILYEMLCDEPPYTGGSVAAVYSSILSGDARPPRAVKPGIPGDLQTVCQKAMERDADRRYATAQDLADDLDRFLTDQPVRARPMSTVRRVVRQVGKHRAHVAVGALAALCVAAGIALVGAHRQSDEFARREREERRRVEQEQLRRDETQRWVELGRKRLDDAKLSLFRRGSDLRDRYAKLREAIELFEKAGADPEARYHAGRTYAMIYVEKSDDASFAAGDAAFASVAEDRPGYPLARLGRGLLFMEKYLDELIVAFFAGESLDAPTPARKRLQDEAVRDLDIAVRGRAGTARDRVLAEVALAVATRNFDRAFDLLGAATAQYEDEEFFVLRARLSLIHRRYRSALEDARRALDKQVNMPNAIMAEYSSLFMMGEFADALQSMDRMLEMHPDHATTLLTRAMARCYMGEAPKSLEDIEHVRRTGGGGSRVEMAHALALTLMGKLSEAEKIARAGLDLSPHQPVHHLTVAAILVSRWQHKDALDFVESAMKINDRYPAAYATRASVYMMQNRFDEALADANKALEIDKECAEGVLIRGIVYARMLRFDEAERDLVEAVRRNPFQKKIVEPLLRAIRNREKPQDQKPED